MCKTWELKHGTVKESKCISADKKQDCIIQNSKIQGATGMGIWEASLAGNPGWESKSEGLQMKEGGAWVIALGTHMKSVHRFHLIQPVRCASGKSPDGQQQLKSELSLICNQDVHWLIAPIHQWNTFGLLKMMAK